jgi:hypothetical protein
MSSTLARADHHCKEEARLISYSFVLGFVWPGNRLRVVAGDLNYTRFIRHYIDYFCYFIRQEFGTRYASRNYYSSTWAMRQSK